MGVGCIYSEGKIKESKRSSLFSAFAFRGGHGSAFAVVVCCLIKSISIKQLKVKVSSYLNLANKGQEIASTNCLFFT